VKASVTVQLKRPGGLGGGGGESNWMALARDLNPAPSKHEATSRCSVAWNCTVRRRVRYFTHCVSDCVLDPVNRHMYVRASQHLSAEASQSAAEVDDCLHVARGRCLSDVSH
jgi:hypothetical protein